MLVACPYLYALSLTAFWKFVYKVDKLQTLNLGKFKSSDYW